MDNSFANSTEDYVEIHGLKMTRVASHFAPKPPKGETDKLRASDGKPPAGHAASPIMRLIGVGMEIRHLCVVVGRLSSQIIRSSAGSDRRLHRVYCYISGAVGLKLTGSVSTSDWDDLKVLAWPDAGLNGHAVVTKSTGVFFAELAGRGAGDPRSRGPPSCCAWGRNSSRSRPPCRISSDSRSTRRYARTVQRRSWPPRKVIRRRCSISHAFRRCRQGSRTS